MFTATLNQGFQMTFDNGYTVSVQWGKGNYCANRSLDPAGFGAGLKEPEGYSCKNAEVAIFDADGDNVTLEFFPENGGATHLSPEQVAAVLFNVSNK